MDIFAGLLVVALVAAFAALVVSPRTARSLDTFAAGFLPYRGAGWPQGVQEEDPVPWSWSSQHDPCLDREDASTALDGPELVEMARADVLATSPVEHGRTIRALGR
jgi:hypothetical protein